MEKIYNILGMIAFWAAAALCCIFVFNSLKDLWKKCRARTWVFQTYEYIQISKLLADSKKQGYENLNWRMVLVNRNRLLGRVANKRQNRAYHIFRHRLIAYYDEALGSEAARKKNVKPADLDLP